MPANGWIQNLTKPRLNVGLVGSGFMGKTHMFGFAAASRVFDLPFEINLECIAEITPEVAEDVRGRFGFRRSTSDWRAMAEDPDIDIFDITAPNKLHKEMALAAIAANKHVYCEKPLATNAADAVTMANAAEAAGVRTQVGFNYLSNPMFTLARKLIAEGQLGEIRSYRGIHAEDYMADASAQWSWRLDPDGGGAFADLGSHSIATAEFLLGPISAVLGNLNTVVGERIGSDGKPMPVEVDDVGHALVRFENGIVGSVEANWVATGQKMQHDFEVYGSKGSLVYTQERLNELRFFSSDDSAELQGFRTIVSSPSHNPYGLFCVAPGHQIGYNELKAIEIQGFVEAIAGLRPEPFNFRAGARVQSLIDAVADSAGTNSWQAV